MKYKTLKTGDIIKKGDEYCSRNEWFESSLVGANVPCHIGYRRPILEKKHPNTNIFK